MKVIYLSSAILPNPWANSYQTVKTCEALKIAGMDIELWAQKRESEETIKKAYGLSVSPIFHFIPMPSGHRPNHLSYSLSILRELAKYKKEKVVLYSRETPLWLALLWAKFFWGMPYVFEIHRRHSLVWYDAVRRFFVIKNASGLVVITKALLNAYNHFNWNIALAFLGVDPVRFADIPRRELSRHTYGLKEKLYLGYAGGFEAHQGLPVLLGAFKEISEKIPELGLFIAGGNEKEISALKEACPGISDRVKFLE